MLHSDLFKANFEFLREIWNEWFKLESDIGDTESIVKVEEKRDRIYDIFGDLDEKATLFQIDRYKFMNLIPCSTLELKSLGYNDLNTNPQNLHYAMTPFSPEKAIRNQKEKSVSPQSKSQVSVTSSRGSQRAQRAAERNAALKAEVQKSINPLDHIPTPFKSLVKERPGLSTPNTEKMFPFKSNTNSLSGLQPIPGCSLFLYPSIFSEVLKRLPPPNCFDVSLDSGKQNFQ